MKLQTAPAALVVGALLVGGATTGTTLALWRDSAVAASSTVTGGTVRLTGSDGTTTVGIALGTASGIPLSTSTTPGASVLVSTTLRHATPATSKNMRISVVLDDVDVATNANLASALQVAASARSGATCPATTTAAWQDVGAVAFTPVRLASALDRQADAPICLYVRMKAGAAVTSYGQSGSLTFAFRGQQERP